MQVQLHVFKCFIQQRVHYIMPHTARPETAVGQIQL